MLLPGWGIGVLWYAFDVSQSHPDPPRDTPRPSRLGPRALSDLEKGTIVVLPSLTFPLDELRKISGIQHYEERMLFALLLLKQPDIRIVYLSSVPIDEAIVDYYLRFVADGENARQRLRLLSVDDPGPRPLTEKLLERADVLSEIRSLLRDSPDAYILPFNVTPLEEELARHIDTPLYGPASSKMALGSKSGARRVAALAGVPCADGRGDLFDPREIDSAIDEIRRRQPGLEAVVIKLNNGFSGQGNAVVWTDDLRSPVDSSRTVFCSEAESWDSYRRKIRQEGAVVEELIRAPGTVSPSVQLRIAPDGTFEPISTHDQILGGPDLQVYLGCRFPARRPYRMEIQRYGLRVAEVLASQGVVGPFGIDFVVVPARGSHQIYLSEINLRLGGTTHPYFMARFLTDGRYDPATGLLVAGGMPKFYVASDNLRAPAYVGLTPSRLIAAVDAAGVSYDPRAKKGAAFHLMGALPAYGKFGALCIGDSPEDAEELYVRVTEILEGLSD